jgi:hypothetical protein
MMSAPLSGFKRSLGGRGYAMMAGSGGSALLYAQIRALASKAAEQALAKAGREGIEAGVFKSLLTQLTQRMPREAGKKAIPIVGALVGGLSDAYFMSRVLRCAKLVYHKRYLFEKEHRVSLLRKPRGKEGE